MKELNNVDMQAVSGAGVLSDAAGLMGGSIGAIIDAIMGGKSTAAADAGRDMAKGIAGIIEAGMGVISNIFGSLFGKKQ